MADAAAARREARRRRILENSQNRLQLISGKCDDDCPREPPIRSAFPEPVHEISDHVELTTNYSEISLNNGVIPSEPDTFELLSSVLQANTNHGNSSGDAEVFGDITSFTAPIVEQAATQTSFWEKLTNYKYDIVMLAVIIQLIYSLSLVTFEDKYFFLPIIIYAITKLIWFPSQSNSRLSNILMLLQGMSSNRIQKVIYIAQCLGVISSDICVFLFTTICIQSLFNTLENILTT